MELHEIEKLIPHCHKCPRLRRYCEGIAEKKKREFRDWDYWGRPVPGFGDPRARIWIIGLAPAAHGANRTGRMFTGDSSGNWLYEALHRYGFANQPTSSRIDDGLVLRDVFISASARCAPPDNKPSPEELAACSKYLRQEWDVLARVSILLALGSIAFESVKKLLADKGEQIPSRAKFSHLGRFETRNRTVFTSYHPSRQNTQTGRLTREMWYQVFSTLREVIDHTNE